MTRNIPLTVVIIAGLVALAGLVYFAVTSPLLYSPQDAQAETQFQVNTDALKADPVNATTDIYPLMQDLLDRPGSVTLNIRLRDLDSADADLAAYMKTYGKLDNLVINLDMNESEIQNFTLSSEMQDEIFEKLANETETLDALKNLEIRYRDSNDPDMLVSVQYQGTALQKRLGELYSRYKQEHEKNLPISAKLNLDTAKYNQSVEEFQKIVQEAEDRFGTTVPVPVYDASLPSSLTLAVEPNRAIYRDTVQVLGHLVPVEDTNATISILMDGNPVKNVTADENGEYTGSLVIERVSRGTHTLVAESRDIRSPEALLIVLAVNSTTTLAAQQDPGNLGVICTGSVLANRPVRFAPFAILENNRTLINGTTDGQGTFNITFPLSAGNHTLIARFNSSEYPVKASESEPVFVEIQKPVVISPGVAKKMWDPFGIILSAACVIVLSAAGAFLYFRKKTVSDQVITVPIDISVSSGDESNSLWELEPLSEPIDPGSSSPLTPDALLRRYEDLSRTEGASNAAFDIYRILAGRAAQHCHIDRYLTRTPREMAAASRNERFGAAFSRFIMAYENIRYAGRAGEEDQDLFKSALVLADKNLRGEYE